MTLVELLTVVVILGITIGVFHLVFVTNWQSFQERTSQADLWQEANNIIETMSREIRSAKQLQFSDDDDTNSHSVTLFDLNGQTLTFVMRPGSNGKTGEFVMVKQGKNPQVLSNNLDLAGCDFSQNSGSKRLSVTLTLQEPVFWRMVRVNTSSEVVLRN